LILDEWVRNGNLRVTVVRLIFRSLGTLPFTRSSDSESFQKEDFDFDTAAGPQAFGDSVVSKNTGSWLD
jgi:hypothetical protein